MGCVNQNGSREERESGSEHCSPSLINCLFCWLCLSAAVATCFADVATNYCAKTELLAMCEENTDSGPVPRQMGGEDCLYPPMPLPENSSAADSSCSSELERLLLRCLAFFSFLRRWPRMLELER